MRAKIYSFMKFDDEGLIDVSVDRDMLKIIRNCIEDEINYMCVPSTYDKIPKLIEEYKTIVDRIAESRKETECTTQQKDTSM